MRGGPRIGVYFTPSPFEKVWREALIQTATTAGWQITEGPSTAKPVPESDCGILWLATSETDIAAAPAVDWLVIADDPSCALATVVAATGTATVAPIAASAIWHTARRFATASSLALDGAAVLEAPAEALDLPHLGLVRRSHVAAVPPITATALNVYQTVPPASGATAVWTRDLFTFSGDCPTGELLPVDLTGRPRVLVYGPHVDLPAGNWRATVRIGVDPEGRRVRLRLEWGPTANMKAASITIRESGHYAIALEQDWPGQAAAEVRIWLEEASFGGRLDLLDVRVERP